MIERIHGLCIYPLVKGRMLRYCGAAGVMDTNHHVLLWTGLPGSRSVRFSDASGG